ncbi:MAG: hypothetical protein ACTXOO_04340 [Sodalis sp. (in: enterobacteria)]
MLLDRPTNEHTFLAYIEQELSLEFIQENIVIINNFVTDKVNRAREAIDAEDAMLLYFLPYSLDFNSIKRAYPKLQSRLGKYSARTFNFL